MKSYDFDLFVIGAGSGGVRTARMASERGLRVAVAEVSRPGGTCVNVGCIPKKLFAYAAQFTEAFQQARGYGWLVPQAAFNWPTLRHNKDAEIERLNGVYRALLVDSGCQLIEGRATIKGAHTVAVGARDWSAERIVIATGGWPFVPDVPGREHAITSNDFFPSSISRSGWSSSVEAILPSSSPASPPVSVRGLDSCIAAICSCAASTRTYAGSQPRRRSGGAWP